MKSMALEGWLVVNRWMAQDTEEAKLGIGTFVAFDHRVEADIALLNVWEEHSQEVLDNDDDYDGET